MRTAFAWTRRKSARSIRNWPLPKDLTELRLFVGLANYFRRFIAGFSSLVAPLTDLFSLQRLPAPLPVQALRAFDELKDRLSNAVLLQYPDVSKPFEVVSDASLKAPAPCVCKTVARSPSPARNSHRLNETMEPVNKNCWEK